MRIVSLFLAAALAGCAPGSPQEAFPPRLMATEVSADGRELTLSFDEPLSRADSAIDETPPDRVPVADTKVRIPLPPGLKPGQGHVWSAAVADEDSNVTTVAGKFYPANPHPAALRLNEVRVAGSGTKTDLIELRVEASGSLGGWTLEVWSGPENRQRTVLPDVAAVAGELLVVRYKTPEEGSDSALGSREYWQAGAKGLSAAKGLILLRPAPDRTAVDGLLYSKKPGEAAPIAEAAGWPDREEFDPAACTATRTWCRTEGPEAKWIVVASGGATPGAPNKLTPWEGQPSNRAGTPKTKGRRNRLPGVSPQTTRRSLRASSTTREDRGVLEKSRFPAPRQAGRIGRNPPAPKRLELRGRAPLHEGSSRRFPPVRRAVRPRRSVPGEREEWPLRPHRPGWPLPVGTG